jgi:RND family efflux transporter MFP subunit
MKIGQVMRTRFALTLAATLAACSGGGEDKAPEPVALVRLAPVAQGPAGRQITVYGAAEPGPMGKMSLVAPIEASVAAIEAPVGTAVSGGQVVVRLSASPTARADVAKANADAAAADAALARAMRLRADGLAANGDVETARAAAVAANALRTSFARRGGALALRAPASGTVETIPVAVGELLQPGAAVATVARATDARARFGIDPASAGLIRPGMTLHIAPTGTRGALTTPVASVSAVVDAQTRLAAVFVRLPAGSGVTPGEPLTATIDAPGIGNALSVPYAALLDDAGQAYVFVVANGIAHRRDVSVQSSNGERATVAAGLRPGEQVVVEGGTAVEDGMKVRTK